MGNNKIQDKQHPEINKQIFQNSFFLNKNKLFENNLYNLHIQKSLKNYSFKILMAFETAIPKARLI